MAAAVCRCRKRRTFEAPYICCGEYMGNLKWYLFLIIVISACTAGLGVLIPMIVGKVVDSMGILPGTADFPAFNAPARHPGGGLRHRPDPDLHAGVRHGRCFATLLSTACAQSYLQNCKSCR